MLSYTGCHVRVHTSVVLGLTHMVVKWRHCYVKVTSSCKIYILAYSGTFVSFFKNKKNSGEQEKESIIHVRVGQQNPSLRSPFVITRQEISP